MDSLVIVKERSGLSHPRLRIRGPRLALLLLPFSLFLAVGCVTLPLLSHEDCPPPSPTPPCQVVAMWSNQVTWTPDPARGGTPTPGLAGRVYLFGPQIGHPMVGDGVVVVDMIDETAVPHGGQGVLVEQWRFDKDTVRYLLRKDYLGWGYTLFLPWSTYRPDITRVQLKVRYEPTLKGVPLYAESSPLTLSHENNPHPGFARGTGSAAPPNTGLARQPSSSPITRTSATAPARPAAGGR